MTDPKTLLVALPKVPLCAGFTPTRVGIYARIFTRQQATECRRKEDVSTNTETHIQPAFHAV